MSDTTASDGMTIEELAAYLQLHPLMVRALARKGELLRMDCIRLSRKPAVAGQA